MDQHVNSIYFLWDAHTNVTNKTYVLHVPNTSRVAKKANLSSSPNLNPDPIIIEKNHNPTDPERRQYPEPHARNPRKHTAREEQEDLIEERELSKSETGELCSLFCFILIQRHPIHYGHSLVVSQTWRQKTGQGHSQRNSIKHNELSLNDGRWSFILRLLFSFRTWFLLFFSFSSIVMVSHDTFSSKRRVLLCT